MNRWIKFADERNVGLPQEKQTTITGYEIAVHFIPSHDVLNRSHLLSQMLLLCSEAGQSFQKKASTILTTALKMETCQSQASIQ